MRRVLTGLEIVALLAALPAIALMSAPPPDALVGGRGLVLIGASMLAIVIETTRRLE